MSMRGWMLLLTAIAVVPLVGCPSSGVQVRPTEGESMNPSPVEEAPDAGADSDGGETTEVSSDAGSTVASTDGGASNATDSVTVSPESSDGGNPPSTEEQAKRDAEDAKRKEAKAKIDASLGEAFKVVKEGDDQKAIEAYRKVITDNPNTPAAHYNLGVLLERVGEKDKAVASYRAALNLKGDFAPASDNLARIHLRDGQAQTAETELRERIGQFKDDMALRNQLVRVLVAQGRDSEAESDAKKILKREEKNVDAMLSLAEIWYRQKKYELARQVLENAREIEPNRAEAWNLLGFVHLALDQRLLALEAFRKAVRREDFPEAHVNLGAMLNEINDCDNAIQSLELAVRYAPKSYDAHLNLGNAYRCGRKYDQALTEYQKALEIEPRATDPLFNLAILYLDSDVKTEFNKDDPNDSEKLQRLKKAVEYFGKYADADGKDTRYERYVAEANKGVKKEEDRIVRAQALEKRAKELEAKKKAEEEARKAEREKWMAEVNRLKVAGKSDVEDDPPEPTPEPIVTPAVTNTGGFNVTVGTGGVVSTPVEPVVTPTTSRMKKIAPKEDEPD